MNYKLKFYRLRRLIAAYERATIDFSWRGSMTVEERVHVEHKYNTLHQKLYAELKSLEIQHLGTSL